VHVRALDGLRGIAVLLVVLYHFWLHSGWWVIGLPGQPADESLEFVQYNGLLGVELFFFISAFCLFYPHAKAMFGLAPLSTVRHYASRRAIKILPSYLLCLLVCGTVLSEFSPVGTEVGWFTDWGLHVTFLHNLLPETTGTFNGVLWSLAVEVQFYVVFPLLAKAARRSPWMTVAGMVGVAVGYRVWARTQLMPVFQHWDNMLPGFLDLFAMGMLAAYLLVLIRQRAAAAQRLAPAFTVLALAGFATLLIMLRWVYDMRFDPGEPIVWQSYNRQYLAVLFLCITVPSVFALEVWQKILANRVLVFLSTISYNLYLWHLIIGLLIKKRGWLPADTPDPTQDPQWQGMYTVIGIAVSIVVATMITYAFERPLLRLGVRGSIQALRDRFTPRSATAASNPGASG
jgi:peptidoglycan/LPS O-acetylase OafA/YrhL